MPIAAIPQGVEIRKISSVQKRALDELLKQQKEQSLLQTAMVALIPSFTALTIAGTFGYIYIHRDTIADQYQELKDDFFSGVGKTIDELRFAVSKKILLINAESENEIIEIELMKNNTVKKH